MLYFAIIGLVVAVGFQVWVTHRIWKHAWFERSQKLNQSKLVWLVPVLGAMIVLSFIQEDDTAQSPTTRAERDRR